MIEQRLKEKSMITACDRNEIFFLHILSKPYKLAMLCMNFFHSAQRTMPNQSSKTSSLGLLPSEKSRPGKQVLKQRTCLFHTALAGEGKTSDGHCLTLKHACLPSGKSVLDTQIQISPCLPFTWDCSLLVADIPTSKWKKSSIDWNTPSTGCSPLSAECLCCWQQQAAPPDNVNVVVLCISAISAISICPQSKGMILSSSTAASPRWTMLTQWWMVSPALPTSPQPYQVSPTDLGAAGIISPVEHWGYRVLWVSAI